MKLVGEHNQANAMFAVTVARRLKVKVLAIKKVLRTFSGLPNRQEVIAVIKGVRYINDTTATTPDATIAALKALSGKFTLHLIFGGTDKELEFAEVARCIKRLKPEVYLLPGTAREKIVTAFNASRIVWHDVVDLKDAMIQILVKAQKGDTVLLSPGCASFGLFKNEFDRGEEFVRLVKSLQAK